MKTILIVRLSDEKVVNNDIKFTSLSIEAIFGKMKKETRLLLKSSIPALRHVRVPEEIVEAEFQCFRQIDFDVMINSHPFNYGLKKIGDRKTEVVKTSKQVQGRGRELKRTVLDMGIDDILENFVRVKLNRKGNYIRNLSVQGQQTLLKHFRPLKARIGSFSICSQENYTAGTLTNFSNAVEITIMRIDMSKEIMDEVMNLKTSGLRVISDNFPDERHLELKNEKLAVEEGTNTFQHFIKFLKKLSTGAHKPVSRYRLQRFTEGEVSDEELYERVSREFPNSRLTMDEEEWQFPEVFDPDQLTVWISEELELNVYQCYWEYVAVVEKRGSGKPAI